MKKVLLLMIFALAVLVVPVQAKQPNTHTPKAKHCEPKAREYKVRGTLVSGTLTKNSDNTYSGDLTITIKKADPHYKAEKGTNQSYTLDHVKRVKLHKGVDPAALAEGSRVRLHARRTRLHKGCDTSNFTPTTTVRRVQIQKPKAPKPPANAAKPTAGHAA